MSDLIRTILIMSISGGIIALLLFALKPLVRNCLPKSVQYYLWLVVVAALLIPVSVFFKLPATTENAPTIMSPSNVVERYFITGEEEMDRMGALDSYGAREASNPIYMQAVKEAESPISGVATFFPFIYPLGVLIALLYYIINYSVFVRLYRRRNSAATSDELAMLAELFGDKQTPLLYRNSLAATPMMIGVFRPTIILPDREYTNEQLHAVLLHELTHLWRKDVLVKWLSVVVTALHWFNPIVWLVRREIDRACELSCDEAVIRNFDTDGKQNYGETLLYVAADAKTPHAVLSTTMCEEKKALKVRLGAIMKSKKHTRLAILVSAVLIIAIGGIALALGAGRAEVLTLPGAEKVLSISMNQYNDYTSIGEVVITDKNEIAQILNDLSGASKLWGMSGTSVNDYPVSDNYLVIDITMQNEGRRLSLYSDSRDYIEEPYIGIYRAKQKFDYMYSLYSAHLNNIMPNTIAENATQPVVTLYGFDQTKDNGDSDPVKKHLTGRLEREKDTNLIVLTDMIFIDVRCPDGTVSMQTYYAGSDGVAHRMSDNKWSHPTRHSDELLFFPSGNTLALRDINPDGFTGSIWAVTTDADGVEHISDDIPVIWVNALTESPQTTDANLPQTIYDAVKWYLDNIESDKYLKGYHFVSTYRILDTQESSDSATIYAHILCEWLSTEGESVSGGAGLVSMVFAKENSMYSYKESTDYIKPTDYDLPQKVLDAFDYSGASYFADMREEMDKAVADWMQEFAYSLPKPSETMMPDENLFSDEEVATAKAVVEKYFKAWADKDEDAWWATWSRGKPENAAPFGDWTITLKDIRYNPQDSMRESYVKHGRGSVNNTSIENVIVFKCDFNVHYPDGIATSAFNEGDYTDWSVILIRQNAEAEWFIDDNGY